MAIYEYTSNSINYLTVSDIGLISSSPISTVDNGDLIAEYTIAAGDFLVNLDEDFVIDENVNLAGSISYGYIDLTSTGYPYGTIKIYSENIYSHSTSFVAAEESLKLYSAAKTIKTSVWVGSGSPFEIGGSANEIIKAFSTVGTSGPLRTSGTAICSAVYSYNNSSVENLDSANYGQISAAATIFENYDPIADTSGGSSENYGYITNLRTTYPFGSFSANGAAGLSFKPAFAQVTTGSIIVSGSAVTDFLPSWSSTGLYQVYGNANTALVKPYIASGIYSNIGSNVEKATFNYSNSSSTTYTTNDLGSITDFVGSGEYIIDSGDLILTSDLTLDDSYVSEYGYVSDSSSLSENYGYIIDLSSVNPFGSLKVGGTSTEEFKPSFAQTTTGSIIVSGSAVTDFEPSWSSTGLFAISGIGATSIAVKTISTGFIYTSGFESNNRSYDYNESSIQYFDTINYGLITVSGVTFNYGFIITATDTANSDYGDILVTKVTYPYGTISVSGSISDSDSRPYKSTGSLFAIGSGTTSKFVSAASETQLFRLSGDSTVKFTRSHAGSGAIQNVGFIDEQIAYCYNHSSIEDYSSTNYGFITTSGITTSYGFVTNGSSVGFDYGYIFDSETLYPFGSFNVIGTVKEEFKPAFAQVTTGSIIVSGSAVTDFEPSWSSTGLFAISGSANTAQIKPYIGNGYLTNYSDTREKVVYNYTNLSIEYYNTINYGLITTSGVTVNYGSINNASVSPLNYGYVWNFDTSYPFGSFNISGSSSVVSVKGAYNTSGSLFAIGSGTTSKFVSAASETQLFRLSGDSTVKFTRSHVGSGAIQDVGFIDEKVTYDYNESSIEDYSSTNYGFITTSGITTSYGFVTNGSSVGFDYGYIFDSEILYPFGSFNIGGATEVEFKPAFAQVTTGSIIVSGSAVTDFEPSWSSTGLFAISGSANSSVIKPYNSVFKVITLITQNITESITYDYNESSIEYFGLLNYGFITASGVTVNYGSITSVAQNESDYGDITISDTAYPYGSFNISGSSSVVSVKGAYNTSGSLFAIGSGTTSKFVSAASETQLFKVSGDSTVKFTRSHVGSGAIQDVGFIDEKVTYDYNESSIEYYSALDYQSITTSGVTVNYGSIEIGSSIQSDFGYIFDSETLYPYGSLNISGQSVEVYKPVFAQITTGSIIVSGSAVTDFEPTWISTGLFAITGSSTSSKIAGYISVGSISNLGSVNEAVTYDYSESSIIVPGSILDYGTIIESVVNGEYIIDLGDLVLDNDLILDDDSIISYNLIGADQQLEFNYGYVYDELDGVYPYGSLNIFGSSSVASAKGTYNTSGSLFAIGSGTTSKFVSAATETQLFKVSGDSTVKFTRSHVGSGAIQDVGFIDEKVTYHYNDSSIEDYSTLDYQSITTSGVTVNYGSITSVAQIESDYGDITISDTLYPFGSLNLSGQSVEVYKPIFAESGGGSVFISGKASTQFLPTWISTGLFAITGSSTSSRITRYTSVGSISNLGSVNEAVTYDYSESSINYYSTLDYQSITTSGVTVNYGSITSVAQNESDYGYIFNIDTVYPYGSFNISGSSSVVSAKGTYNTSGSLFAIGSGTTSKFVSAATETQLFKVSGDSTVKFTANISGFGSVSGTGIKTEKVAYDYNESSIVDSGAVFDYGSITASGIAINYGITDQTPSEEFDYGYVFDSLAAIYPYGRFTLSGNASSNFLRALVQTTLGDIKVSGIAKTSYIPGPVLSRGTFRFTGSSLCVLSSVYSGSGSYKNIGSKIEKTSYNYNQSSIVLYDTINYGLITVSGVTFNYGSIITATDTANPDYGAITNVYANYPFGSFTISGAVKYNETRYIPYITGSGSLFAIGGESNAYSRIAVSETQIFKVSGAAQTPRTRPFIGSGSLFSFNSLTESKAVNPPATGLFRFSGSAIEKNTESYVGSGSITLQTAIYPEYLYYRPTPRYVTTSGDVYINGASNTRYFAVYTKIGSGSIFATGSGTGRYLPIYYGSGSTYIYNSAKDSKSSRFIGSGSLFTFNSSTESKSSNPPESTFLFRISGSASENHTETFSGSGTEFVSGNAFIARANSFAGSGSLFTYRGSSESQADVAISTGLYKISGQSSESYSRATYIGSGNLFNVSGASESKTYRAPTETQLFRVSGTAVEKETSTFIGSGRIFEFGGTSGARTVVVNPEQPLVRISGSSTQKFNRVFTASGSEYIYGSSKESTTDKFVGNGSIFVYGSSKETVSKSKVLDGSLSITGTANINLSRGAYKTTGTLFSIGGSSESSTKVVPSETLLFRISGVSTASKATSNKVSGSAYIRGSVFEKNTESYIGSGRLFNISGSIESITYRPQTDTTLFKFIGNATTSRTQSYSNVVDTRISRLSGSASVVTKRSYDSSGSTFVAGASTETFNYAYVGSGSLFTIDGATESITSNPPEEKATLVISGQATNVARTSAFVTSGTFTYVGNATEEKTNAFEGSGTLFTVISTTSSRSIQFVSEEALRTRLFTIVGESDNAYSRIAVAETAKFIISGDSDETVIVSQPPRVFGTII